MVVKTRTNVYECHYHLVFVTKYRKEIFVSSELRVEAKELFRQIASENDFLIEGLEVLPEHVHMLLSFAPTYSISQTVKKVKGIFARKWFQKYPQTKELLWNGQLRAPSYYIGTLGTLSKEVVEKYIENQLTEYNAGKPRRDSFRG